MTIPFTSFEVPLDVVIIGIVAGMAYGLLALGLTLVYRSAKVINFAHVQLGAVGATVMVRLVVFEELPYAVGLLGGVAVAVALGALTDRLVIRRLFEAPRLVVMIATIGVAQALSGLAVYLLPRPGPSTSRFFAKGFPTPFEASVSIGGLQLHEGELLILAVVPALTFGLNLFLRRSKVGLGARASSDNLEAARLAGIPARRISLVVWSMAGLLAAACAILVGPTQPLSSSLGASPNLMIRVLAAALLGGLTSFPQVFAGGLAVGVIEALVLWNYPTGGVVELVMFAVILGSMFARSDLGRNVRGLAAASWSLAGATHALDPAVAAAPRVRAARSIGLVGLAAVAILLPLAADTSQQALLSGIVLFATMGLSLTVLTGYAGQVSLAQYTFVALGGVIGGRMLQLGFPEWAAILYTIIGGGIVAAVVGLPALRMRGLLLAVTTLAFAVAGGSWLIEQTWLVQIDDGQSSLHIPRPTWFGVDFQSERNYYYLCLGVLVVVAALVVNLRRTGLGRALMAVRDNDAAAASLSVPPRRVKLIGFVLAGSIASLAGYFYGGLFVNFSNVSGLTAVGASQSLLAMVIFGGVTTVTGTVLGAIYVQGMPYLFGARVGILSTGIGLLLVLVLVPGGLSGVVFRLRDWIVGRLVGDDGTAPDPTAEVVARQRLRPRPVAPLDPSAPPPLAAEGLVVSFSGLRAVSNVSIHAGANEIVGLVGPNGAGKTTLFDVLTGQTRPTEGRVLIAGRDVTSLRPEERAVLGVGRSFQDAKLFPELPLLDAMRLALEVHEPTEVVPAVLGLPPSWDAERRKRHKAEEIIEMLGLQAFAHKNCGELSTGTRRFAELGCLVAMGSKIVLLDEPTAGIAQREVEQFVPVLREIREHLGATMIVIEHDIPMMMQLVDRLYVMAAGELIAEGPPTVVRDDPNVVAAYLGTDERAIARSGGLTRPTAAPSPPRRRQLTATGRP